MNQLHPATAWAVYISQGRAQASEATAGTNADMALLQKDDCIVAKSHKNVPAPDVVGWG